MERPRFDFGWPGLLLATAIVSSLWSFSGARELDVWFFELVPGVLGVTAIVLLARWFRFSGMTYLTLCIAFVFIATGARYTYAEVPVPQWINDILGGTRNHFDRLGHFVQGLTVGMIGREILRRRTVLGRRFGVPLLSVAISLAFSGFYELVEWWTVLIFYPDHGPEWLGMQGDPWDAQQDMSMALLGAIVAATLLAPLHDRSIRRVDPGGFPQAP